jgi:hypothetical protein
LKQGIEREPWKGCAKCGYRYRDADVCSAMQAMPFGFHKAIIAAPNASRMRIDLMLMEETDHWIYVPVEGSIVHCACWCLSGRGRLQRAFRLRWEHARCGSHTYRLPRHHSNDSRRLHDNWVFSLYQALSSSLSNYPKAYINQAAAIPGAQPTERFHDAYSIATNDHSQ